MEFSAFGVSGKKELPFNRKKHFAEPGPGKETGQNETLNNC